MPRPERSLDPSAGPVESLAADLRKLRAEAGNPGYRELSALAGFSVSVLANAAGGRRLPSLAVTLGFVRACGGDPQEWETRWRQAAAEWTARQDDGHARADGEGNAEAPYRGLAEYGVEDADRFFGRESVVRSLAGLVREQRFVAVFGVSGSGKSSLLRAGLVPAMSGAVPVLITPGAEPREELRRELAEVPAGRDVLLVVDQFEELFTMCGDPGERAAFVAGVADVAEYRDNRVVIAVRADFYAQCTALPQLAGLLASATMPLGPLSEDEMREVVTRPARLAGASVERALVTKILADAAGQAGALPLVSHALLETWQQRRGDVLTLAGYEAAGGMTGAIAQTAEEVYAGFDTALRDTAREVLARLVTLGEGVQDTRRRVQRAELDFPGTDVVLHRFAAARLVVLDEGAVEIAHEALVSAWPRLHDLLHGERDLLRMHRQLTEASQIWSAHHRDPGALYRGARLAAWEGHSTGRLNASEREFLGESRELERRETAARRRRVRVTVTSLVAVVVVLAMLTGLALLQTRRANQQRDLALSRLLVTNARSQLEVDQEVALLLAKEAFDTAPTEQAQAALRQTYVDSRIRQVLPSGQGQVFGVAYSSDGQRIASSGADGTVRVWRRDGPDRWQDSPQVLRGPSGYARNPVFSQDGKWLACGDDKGTVTVWNLAGAADQSALSGHEGILGAIAFSPDGERLASGGEDGVVRVRDRDGRRELFVQRPGGPISAVAFSPDGRYLAVGGDKPIWIFDMLGQRPPDVLEGNEASVKDLAFSPDGRRLASAGSDQTVRVWDVAGLAAPLVLRGNDGYVESVAFSPDGGRVASSHSESNTIRVWSATTADDPVVLHGHDGTVWSVAFSPDGSRLASGSSDGTLRFWDPARTGGSRVLRGHEGAVWSVAVSPDGSRVVSGGDDRTVRLWQGEAGTTPLVLRGNEKRVIDVAISTDGHRVAGAGSDGAVRIWNADGAADATVLRGHEGAVLGVSFSPDGRQVASAGRDSTVRIWDVAASSTRLVLRGHRDQVRSVQFSPDGRHVVSTDNAGVVRVWNAVDQAAPAELRGHPPGLAWCAAFSPDGRRVASGGQEGSLRVWNISEPDRPLVLRGHRGSVWSVAFSPTGGLLASTGDDNTLRIWNAVTGTELVTYRGWNSSVEEVAFVPGGDDLITAHDDGTVRRWPCEACRPIGWIRDQVATRTTRELTPEERAAFATAAE